MLPHLPDDSVDLIHTSPPSNIEKPYASSVTDNAPLSEYLEFLASAIAEMKRVVRPGGSIFWQTGYTQDDDSGPEIVPIDHLSHDLFRSDPHPFQLWDRIIWRYWGGHAFTKKFTNKHETIMWYVKPGAEPQFCVDEVREQAKSYDKRNNFWGRNPGNVWEVDRVAFGSTGQTSHIAVFPEEVTERIVRACSRPGDLVLDPFSGSGTVAKVARSLGRRWLGIEISPEYARESAVRIGKQQPCERDALASALIADLGFGHGGGLRTIDAIAELLSSWITEIDWAARQMDLEQDVDAVFSERNGRTPMKAVVWEKYDQILSDGPEGDRVIRGAEIALYQRYKLRRQFNGVSRYRRLLALIGELEAAIQRGTTEEYVSQVVRQEPSTYTTADGVVTYVGTERATKGISEAASSTDLSVDQAEPKQQGRLL